MKTSFFFLLLLTAFTVPADTYTLDLARITLIDGAEIRDSYVEPPHARGTLTIETDADNIVRSMRFDAWFRGEDEKIFDDTVITTDWNVNGALYEVFSLIDDTVYQVSFLRRSPPDEIFDPAIMILLDSAILDYRY